MIYFTKNIRTLSIGSWGCNLRCLGCQNARLSWAESGNRKDYQELTPAQIIRLATEKGCKGICYTFNEPGILLELIANIAMMAKRAGLFNILVTNSTLTTNSVEEISQYTDAVAADIKSMEDNFYYRYCGAGGIHHVAGKILECIKTFKDNGCHVEVRTNIITGLNDHENDFHGIAAWIRDNLGYSTPWHITRFFPAFKLSHLSATPASSMLKAQQIGFEEGLTHVHTFFGKGCDCAREDNCCKN